MRPILRSVILERLGIYEPWSVPYDQGSRHQVTKARKDCSGFVSLVWDLDLDDPPESWGGYNTSTLVSADQMYEIDWSQLRPGDAIGNCGPGTAPKGHVGIWLACNTTPPSKGARHQVLDHGTGLGPRYRTITAPSNYRAWRRHGVIEEESPIMRGIREPGGSIWIEPGTVDQATGLLDLWPIAPHPTTGKPIDTWAAYAATNLPLTQLSKALDRAAYRIHKPGEPGGGGPVDLAPVLVAIERLATSRWVAELHKSP